MKYICLGYMKADKFETMSESERNVESLDNLIGNEQRKLALAEERYRKGLPPFIEVVDAQRSLYAAQSDRVSAAAELSRGYIALNKAVSGRGTSTNKVTVHSLVLKRSDRRYHVTAPSMQPTISVTNLSKTYASGFRALNNINLDIRQGEIFALLGPNGAGKTTLIGIICGIVNPSEGTVLVDGHDIVSDYRAARSTIGLVPQELTTDAFESVWNTVSFSRGLFGKPANPAHIEKVLRDLSLWNKKDSKVMTLSGGMKRRLLIAKALSHEPRILFLDEPTAGVDVELRRDMWDLVRSLKDSGVTIILTTHYIDEAEEMADRIGVINKGEIILVEEKTELIRKLGRKQLTLHLEHALGRVPPALFAYNLELAGNGGELIYTYDERGDRTGITALLQALPEAGIRFKDLQTTQSSLEDIFVTLVRDKK